MTTDTTPPTRQPGANIPPIKIYPDKFSNHVIVVTGASQGIGRRTASLFASQGASVVLVDIAGEKLAALATELTAQGATVVQKVCDLTQEAAVGAMIEEVIASHGKIDVLVHLAGIYPFIPILNVKTADYARIMSVNMDSCFYLTRAILPFMQKAGYGRIIHTSTAGTLAPSPGMSAYIASKGAVAAFTRAVATEAGPGVTINAVSPAMIFTESTWSNPGARGVADAILARQQVKRVGLPSDVAHMICFIASPESEWITGHMFDVSGGAVFT
ncbi:hypothetical protein H2200_008748 [Cladophialophora chaetospira]|uniref:Ketoreductase domain-containing protein n=1 Tax=Cladophialophora chaetospira TaxID=386627 RepID=A0AA38X4L6_9EURO|nr:hypothetical protein H2200_008748 [Cladophialophora chaetospira]